MIHLRRNFIVLNFVLVNMIWDPKYAIKQDMYIFIDFLSRKLQVIN